MQIEIVRHHGRAENADGDVEHFRIGHDLRRRQEPTQNSGDWWRRGHDLNDEADRDHDQQSNHEGFEKAEALVHQKKQKERVERGDQCAGQQWNAEQELQGDRGADDLGEVAGDDRQFADRPQQEIDGTREGLSRQACARSRPVTMP